MRFRLPLACLLLAASAAPAADAKTIPAFHQVVGSAPLRAYNQVGFVPIAGIRPETLTIRAGGDRHRGIWNNVMVSDTSTTKLLRRIARSLRWRGSWENHGVYADRPLSARERRRFEVAVDLFRDADILVVADGHPACAGLTQAQARGIARGRIRRWSEVVALPPGQPDTIDLRLVGDPEGPVTERRFGTPFKGAPGARIAHDGGIGAALSGDRAVAAVTSWSRWRGRPGACAVPIGGVAPTDASVHALAYPGAYAVTFVVARKRIRSAYQRKLMAAYLRFLRSAHAGELFKRYGVLLAGEAPG